MAIESQKKAREKWNRENKKVVSIGFYPVDADLLEHLNAKPNKAGYIKSLIRADMEKSPK